MKKPHPVEPEETASAPRSAVEPEAGEVVSGEWPVASNEPAPLTTSHQPLATSSLLEIITAAGTPGIAVADLPNAEQEQLDDLECKGLISRGVGRDSQGNDVLVIVSTP